MSGDASLRIRALLLLAVAVQGPGQPVYPVDLDEVFPFQRSDVVILGTPTAAVRIGDPKPRQLFRARFKPDFGETKPFPVEFLTLCRVTFDVSCTFREGREPYAFDKLIEDTCKLKR